MSNQTLTYEFEGVQYDFVLTNKAKIEIENAQKGMFQDNPEIVALAMSMEDVQKSYEDCTDPDKKKELKKELDGINLKLFPFMDKLNDISVEEIAHIVLRNHPTYRDKITKDFWERMVDDMDLKLGIEPMMEFFTEVKSKVFTQIANIQQREQAVMQTKNFVANKK